MLDILLHTKNFKAHAKAALFTAAGGAAGAIYTIAADPVKVANFTSGDWHQVKATAITGAVMALIGFVIPSPYTRQPPAVGQ